MGSRVTVHTENLLSKCISSFKHPTLFKSQARPPNAEETGLLQKSYNFSYTDNQIVTIQLNLDMETYFPSFDDHSTFYKGNTIHQFNLREKQTDSGSPISDSWIDIDNAPQE